MSTDAETAPVMDYGAYRFIRAERRGRVLTLAAAAISLSVLVLALTGFGPGATHFVAAVYPPNALAERSWGDFSRAILARPSVLMQWVRVPVLTGLALGLTAITRSAFEI